jgi:exosortase/archaeosortase family protein
MRGLTLDRNVIEDLLVYLIAALGITVFVYYVPSYFLLEQLSAIFSSRLLNLVGIPLAYSSSSGRAFVGPIQVVRECTGVQVIAVMAGLVLPIRRSSWVRKLKVLSIVSVILFVMNFLRIVLELWLVYRGILPWSLAHYPLSLLLGIAGVYTLVLVSDLMFPELGDQLTYFYLHLVPSEGEI